MTTLLLPKDALAALGSQPLQRCENRSLFLSRYVDARQKKDQGKTFLEKGIAIGTAGKKLESWRTFLLNHVGLDNLIFGESQSRLLINMAGGVLENANINLDRLSGHPFIPGSAVKGCARKAAFAELRDAEEKGPLLHDLALVFGWSDQDWSDESDFAKVCGKEAWAKARFEAANALLETLQLPPARSERPWRELGSFAGRISFLPAYPWRGGQLQLDVLTPHHQKYYGSSQGAVATDDESPVPVAFPAVAANTVFVFAVLGDNAELRAKAGQWLRLAMTIHGIGAKTAAGYGWFEDITESERDVYRQRQEKVAREAALRRAEEERRAAEEAARARRQEEANLLATLTPEQKEDYEIAKLTDAQFESRFLAFEKLEPLEKAAIARAIMGVVEPSRVAFQERINQRIAKKKKPWPHLKNLLAAVVKQEKLGKLQ